MSNWHAKATGAYADTSIEAIENAKSIYEVCFWILDKAIETNDFYIITNDMVQEFMSYCVCCNQWGLGSLVIGSSPTEYLR